MPLYCSKIYAHHPLIQHCAYSSSYTLCLEPSGWSLERSLVLFRFLKYPLTLHGNSYPSSLVFCCVRGYADTGLCRWWPSSVCSGDPVSFLTAFQFYSQIISGSYHLSAYVRYWGSLIFYVQIQLPFVICIFCPVCYIVPKVCRFLNICLTFFDNWSLSMYITCFCPWNSRLFVWSMYTLWESPHYKTGCCYDM